MDFKCGYRGNKADLHTHSCISDGTYSPSEVVRLAGEDGIGLLALTDHDTVYGVNEAMLAGEQLGVFVIPGIEIDTMHSEEIHMLGLGIDPSNAKLAEALKNQMARRSERNVRMVSKLFTLGYDIKGRLGANSPSMTRLHIANALVDCGYVSSRGAAFSTLIGQGCPAYVDFDRISTKEAIELIDGAGGVAVMAHPCKLKGNVHSIVGELARAGLWGVEAYYPSATGGQRQLHISLAMQYGLFVTCGSDFHGANRPNAALGCTYTGDRLLKEGLSALMSSYLNNNAGDY